MNPDHDPNRFVYGVDQWPPAGALAVLGAQWLVLVVPGVLVLGEVVTQVLHLEATARVAFIGRLFILTGLVQAAQTFLGHRLPAIVGPSSVLLVGTVASAGAGAGAVFGAMAIGGAAAALVGFTGLAARLRRLFTPTVLAATLMLVAMSLGPVMRDLIFHPGTIGRAYGLPLLFCLALVAAMLWGQHHLRGLWSSAVLLLGLVVGSLVYHLLDLGRSAASSWVPGAGGLLPTWPPFHPDWQPAVIGSMALCYLALIANELATVESTATVVEACGHKGRLNRAVAVSGLGGALAGLFGCLGPVSYAVSPGVAISSRSASRYSLIPCAAALVALGLWPRALGLFGLVPPPVVGAVLFTVMASQIMASLRLLFGAGRTGDWASGTVVGAAVMTAVVVSFMPEAARLAIIPALRPLLANGFVAGLAVALVLEHLLLRRKAKK